MKKNNVFVYLYPELSKDEGWNDSRAVVSRDQVIKKRYVDKGYEFNIARFVDDDREYGIGVQPDRVIRSTGWKDANYQALAERVNPENYASVRVGGYHCFDCVRRFALELYKLNQNVLIDTDLTEYFVYRIEDENFDYENYDLEKAFNNFTKSVLKYDGFIDPKMQVVAERCVHPVYGMKDMVEKKLSGLLVGLPQYWQDKYLSK